jgi:hypothetical protein
MAATIIVNKRLGFIPDYIENNMNPFFSSTMLCSSYGIHTDTENTIIMI